MQGKIWLSTGESFELNFTAETYTDLKEWIKNGQAEPFDIYSPEDGLEIVLTPGSVTAIAGVQPQQQYNLEELYRRLIPRSRP